MKPPKHLSSESRKWWRDIERDYAPLSPHHYRLVQAVCETWDRLQAARRAIDEHGTIYLDRFLQPRTRPEVAIERDCRIGLARLLRELGLTVDDTPAVQPRKGLL